MTEGEEEASGSVADPNEVAQSPLTGAPVARHALLLLAATLVLATGVLFAQQIQTHGPPSVGPKTSVRAASSELEPNTACAESGKAQLTVEAADFSPKDATITLNLSLCFPMQLFRNLGTTVESDLKSSSVFAPKAKFEPELPPFPTAPPAPTLEPFLKNQTVQVGFARIIPAGANVDVTDFSRSVIRQTHLSDLFLHASRYGGEELPTVKLPSLVVPVAGTTKRYPFDWYASVGEVYIATNTMFFYCGNPRACTTTIPFQATVLKGPNLGPFELAAGDGPNSPDALDGAVQTVGLRLDRGEATRWYVVIVALIPLVLGLLLCVVLFSNRVLVRRGIGPEAIAGVAAVLLAILPIRSVLVPTEVSELTLVDYWLGFEMAVLAGLACVAVWRALGGAPK